MFQKKTLFFVFVLAKRFKKAKKLKKIYTLLFQA